MKSVPILLTCLVSFISLTHCKDLVVGETFNNRLLWEKSLDYSSIPSKKMIKEVFFYEPDQQIIRGLIFRDLDHSDAIPSITAGGVGFTYANLRLKSESGSGINFQIEIYG